MPDSAHPLLQEEANAAAAAGEPATAPAAPETPPVAETGAPPAPPQEAPAAPAAEPAPAQEAVQQPAPPETITLSRSNLYGDIAQLMQSDPDVNRRVREFLGRSMKREAQEEIAQLRSQNEDLERQAFSWRVRTMSKEELDNAWQEDENFRAAYTQLINDTPEKVAQRQSLETERGAIQTRVAQLFDQAAAAGLSPQQINAYESAFEYCQRCRSNDHGYFEHDPQSGRLYSEMYDDPQRALREAFSNFQTTIVYQTGQKTAERKALAAAQNGSGMPPTTDSTPAATPAPAGEGGTPPAQPPAAGQPAEQPAPAPAATAPAAAEPGAPNPHLTMTPDMTAAGRPGAATEVTTRDQLREMTPPEKAAWMAEHYPNPGDFENAVKSGRVAIPGVYDAQ